MTLPEAACWVVAALALLPAMMTLVNLRTFRPPGPPGSNLPLVSVIVPARNEAQAIGPCLAALRASTGVTCEIIVVDDQSTDGTAGLVLAVAREDPRVRLHTAPPLPPGWSGKMHACAQGARQARGDLLLFLDCDVRVAPGAVAAIAGYLRMVKVPLASGFPRQVTGTPGETLLIPLMHVVLLGWLPIWMMRRFRSPGFGAGCGQIMVAHADTYRRVGGHAAIRDSWHDGLHLPRAFRRAGHATDIFDAAPLAECRMYRSLAEAWRGLARNADAGMATPAALPLWTLLLAGGMVAPFPVLVWSLGAAPGAAVWAVGGATVLLLAARLAIAVRFRQGALALLLWPFGILAFLALQWRVLLAPPRALAWRGRTRAGA